MAFRPQSMGPFTRRAKKGEVMRPSSKIFLILISALVSLNQWPLLVQADEIDSDKVLDEEGYQPIPKSQYKKDIRNYSALPQCSYLKVGLNLEELNFYDCFESPRPGNTSGFDKLLELAQGNCTTTNHDLQLYCQCVTGNTCQQKSIYHNSLSKSDVQKFTPLIEKSEEMLDMVNIQRDAFRLGLKNLAIKSDPLWQNVMKKRSKELAKILGVNPKDNIADQFDALCSAKSMSKLFDSAVKKKTSVYSCKPLAAQKLADILYEQFVNKNKSVIRDDKDYSKWFDECRDLKGATRYECFYSKQFNYVANKMANRKGKDARDFLQCTYRSPAEAKNGVVSYLYGLYKNPEELKKSDDKSKQELCKLLRMTTSYSSSSSSRKKMRLCSDPKVAQNIIEKRLPSLLQKIIPSSQTQALEWPQFEKALEDFIADSLMDGARACKNVYQRVERRCALSGHKKLAQIRSASGLSSLSAHQFDQDFLVKNMPEFKKALKPMNESQIRSKWQQLYCYMHGNGESLLDREAKVLAGATPILSAMMNTAVDGESDGVSDILHTDSNDEMSAYYSLINEAAERNPDMFRPLSSSSYGGSFASGILPATGPQSFGPEQDPEVKEFPPVQESDFGERSRAMFDPQAGLGAPAPADYSGYTPDVVSSAKSKDLMDDKEKKIKDMERDLDEKQKSYQQMLRAPEISPEAAKEIAQLKEEIEKLKNQLAKQKEQLAQSQKEKEGLGPQGPVASSGPSSSASKYEGGINRAPASTSASSGVGSSPMGKSNSRPAGASYAGAQSAIRGSSKSQASNAHRYVSFKDGKSDQVVDLASPDILVLSQGEFERASESDLSEWSKSLKSSYIYVMIDAFRVARYKLSYDCPSGKVERELCKPIYVCQAGDCPMADASRALAQVPVAKKGSRAPAAVEKELPPSRQRARHRQLVQKLKKTLQGP